MKNNPKSVFKISVNLAKFSEILGNISVSFVKVELREISVNFTKFLIISEKIRIFVF